MKLVYLADIRFPMERANGIQTIETCHALARRGVEVELVVRRTDARTDAECLAYFGLEPHPKLRLRRVRARARLGFLLRAAGLMLASEASDVLYTRDLILADLATKLADAALVYEAHTVAAVFAEERGRMYEDGSPPTPRSSPGSMPVKNASFRTRPASSPSRPRSSKRSKRGTARSRTRSSHPMAVMSTK